MVLPREWVKMETRRGAGEMRKQGLKQKGPTLYKTGHCQPELTDCHSRECLHTFTTYIELSWIFFNLIYVVSYSIYFPKLFFPPHNLTFVKLIHVNTCHSRSLIVHCCAAFLCVNIPHLIHFPPEGHIAYPPFSAIINNTDISIRTWAYQGNSSQTMLQSPGGLNKSRFRSSMSSICEQ